MRVTKLTYDLSDPTLLDKIGSGIENSLKSNLYTFERIRTTGTAKYLLKNELILVVPGKNELCGNNARFIGRVKKHFSGLQKPEKLSSERSFYEYFVPISTYTTLENVVEIDINGAYWESANRLGYLGNDLYKDAEKVTKKARLISLGVLGKKIVNTKFSPPYDQVENYESYPETRVFWENIVWNLGEAIRGTTTRYKPHVFGVWFDAIFCTKNAAPNIRRYLQRRGYETKIKPVRSYVIKPRNGFIPGAKIERIFMDGTRKEMDVTYQKGNNSLDDFLEAIR